MPDYGAAYADKSIAEAERKIRETYSQALTELRAKFKAFNERFEAKDKKKRKQVKNGEITKSEYDSWEKGQAFQSEQWKGAIKEVSQVLENCNDQAIKMINESRLDVFSENYNFTAFIAENMTGINFNIYNTQAVAQLIRDNPKVLPEWKIDEPKDYVWNQKKVTNVITQGIIQGEGVKEMTKRLCSELCTQNENKMRMFAQTAITEAQSAGRQQQMNDAAEMGIEVHKQWLATMDSKTRDSHRRLDGQERPYNEDFDSILGPIKFPGDPDADPANVYRCRCTIVSIYPKYEDRSKRSWREDIDIEGKSFAEWKGEEAYSFWVDHKLNNEYQVKTEEISLEATKSTKEDERKYENEMLEKGFVGLSGAESDEFMTEYHNKRIIGKHGENTMYGDQSRRINEALRNGSMPTDKKDAALVKKLDDEIKRNSLPKDMTLFRGVTLSAFKKTGVFEGFKKTIVDMGDYRKPDGKIDIEAWSRAFEKAQNEDNTTILKMAQKLVGTTVKDDGFMQVSASSERNIFIFSDVNIQIHGKKGTNAYISDYLSESEIILGRGTEIRIVGAEMALVKAENGRQMEILQLIAEIVE